MPSPTTFALIPVAALAASAALLFTGFGGLDRWLAPQVVDPGPVPGLLGVLARTPRLERTDRPGVHSEDQRATLEALRAAPDGLARAEALLPTASGVFRADLLVICASARAAAGNVAGATEALTLAHALVPTELHLLVGLAALQARAGDLAAFAGTVREWRQLGGVVPPEQRADVERWLSALGAG
jgi:hypothetical protein